MGKVRESYTLIVAACFSRLLSLSLSVPPPLCSEAVKWAAAAGALPSSSSSLLLSSQELSDTTIYEP